jgi:hypothetical protein
MEIVENVNSISNTDHNHKFGLATADIDTVHQLTLGHVWKHHKAIIGWSFFWAMCAVGWYVLIFYASRSKFTISVGDLMDKSMEP